MKIRTALMVLGYAAIFAMYLAGSRPNPVAALWVAIATVWMLAAQWAHEDHMDTLKKTDAFLRELHEAVPELKKETDDV